MPQIKEHAVYQQSEQQFYEVFSWEIDAPDCTEAGYLNLLDITTGNIERYTIWLGDEDLSFYYVCLYCEDEEDEDDTEVVNIEAFGIHVYPFSQLSLVARINAAQQFANEERKKGKFVTVQHAYRTLLKEKRKRVFDFDGGPAWRM